MACSSQIADASDKIPLMTIATQLMNSLSCVKQILDQGDLFTVTCVWRWEVKVSKSLDSSIEMMFELVIVEAGYRKHQP